MRVFGFHRVPTPIAREPLRLVNGRAYAPRSRSRFFRKYPCGVIPTLIIVGLVLGNWWRVLVPVAAVGWAVLLIATDVDSGLDFAVGAAALGAVNVVVGVLLHHGVRYSLRAVRTRQGASHP